MDMLEVGKIVNTHGLAGEVKVVVWMDYPDDFEKLTTVYVTRRGTQVELTVTGIKYQKNNIIVKFKEITSIDEAEKYKGLILSAERSELGDLPEGVYYITDLIGLNVIDDQGTAVGKIKDVFSTGSNDVYVVERVGKRDLLLPVIDEVVLSVDITGGTVTVHIMEGLEDL